MSATPGCARPATPCGAWHAPSAPSVTATPLPGSCPMAAAGSITVVGAALLGIVGAFVAVPAAVALGLILDEVVLPRIERR